MSRKTSTGYEYLYYDAKSKVRPGLSAKTLKDPTSALYRTLAPLYQPGPTTGRIFYNDEKPGRPSGPSKFGHTKGVLAYDTASDTAIWLVHSTPHFPATASPKFPASGHGNGQTFLAMTLSGVADAEKIAAIMHEMQVPQTYGVVVPKGLSESSPLYRLSHGVDFKSKAGTSAQRFRTPGGKEFRLFAKNRAWDDDLWRDLVAEDLNVDLDVETWRRLVLNRAPDGSKESKDGKESVEDVRYINLLHVGVPYEWHFTKDHAKLATSREYDWVIVADINRDQSQAQRGGGAVAFQDPRLWDTLTRAEVIYDPSIDLAYQKLQRKKAGKAQAAHKGGTGVMHRPIKARGMHDQVNVSVTLEQDMTQTLEKLIGHRKNVNSMSDAVRYLVTGIQDLVGD